MAHSTPARTPLKPGSGPGPRTVYRATPRRARKSTRNRRIAVLVILVLVALVIIRGLTMQGNVASGVSVNGVDIGGLSPDDAKQKLKDELVPQLNRNVAVTLDSQSAPMNPSELDTRIDVTRTVDRAMQTGRLMSLVLPLVYSSDIAPTVSTPVHPRIPANLRLISEPAHDASVRIANGKTTISPARDGHSISPRAILLATANAALAGERRLVLKSKITKPAISTAAAKQAASEATQLASAPVALNADGNRVGALSTATLQNAVMVRNVDGKAKIAFSPKVLAPAVTEVLGSKIRDPQNAMWDTNGQRAWVVPAKDGIGFDPQKVADAVSAAAVAGGARQADIELTHVAPKRSTDDATKLGITTKIAGAVTELGDSSENRIHNVALMAGILDNRLVMPGDQFSFNDAVGPRTTERGFLEGSAIVDGLLLPSIGGGVCQVASTLFEAVYNAGLEVDERHNHDLYISHYPLGMDATVSWSDLDFRFTNNTDHPILIRATADNSTMLVNLYSSPSDGRTVETSTSDRYDIKPAQKRFIIDKYAAPGSAMLYTDGQDGFSVDVHRVVKKDGKVLSDNTFVSTYAPQPKTYIAAPDANLPGDADIEQPPWGWVSPNDPKQRPYTG
jgi:vancomycin resistance protein YoaR